MARRKHDEGSVFKRKDGRYVAQLRLENGKKQQRYFEAGCLYVRRSVGRIGALGIRESEPKTQSGKRCYAANG